MASLLAEAARAAVADGPLDRRLVAIRLVGLGDAKTARVLFPTLLDARQPISVQLAVLQTLSGLLDRDMARQILVHWSSMSPAVRREAVEVLFGRGEGIHAVIAALESRAMTASELDPARLAQLRTHPDATIRSRAQKILNAETSTSRDRGQVMASYRRAVTLAGNREQGREIFGKICATCHQAEGQGVDVGPNLATVTGRSAEDLLVHILDPNREVAPNYVNYNVATESGRIASGIIAEESATALVLKRAEGASDVIPRDQIEAVTSTGVSLMPEGLEKGLSSQDLANLIAFLRSIRPSSGSIALPAVAR
jgi:putative heme-binding domain-containing protein